ncbi:MNIO family bufferin maturase [Congregibacter sp.]|uniref:MNIO family bufferin maturase n=1 Tax=Congregibacter sp. TaxID=2744308 RepID=UPI003F6AAFCC
MKRITEKAGYGIGLRRAHYENFLAGSVPVDFVEVISENYMVDGGNPLRVLESVRRDTPVILHGVSMSIGSADGLDDGYLQGLKRLAERIEPLWVSDHICWTRTSAHNSHDLLPLPYTAQALDVVCKNIEHAQDVLGRELVLENPSSYLTFPCDEMTEWEFIAAITRRTGCQLLLDINNVVVSAHNHNFSADEYIAGLPLERVRQVHLAGHSDGQIKIDTHDQPVCDVTWDLYARTRPLLGEVAVMIERDDKLPTLDELLGELTVARNLASADSIAHQHEPDITVEDRIAS